MQQDYVPPPGSQTIESVEFRACDSTTLETVSMPNNWRSDVRPDMECGIYVFNFEVLDANKSIAFLVPSYRFHLSLKINDVEFAKSKGRRNQILPFYAEIPSLVLNEGVNKASLTLLSDPKGEGFIKQIVVGQPDLLLEDESKLIFLRHTSLLIITVMVLIFSGISLFFYLAERTSKEFLYFSLLTVAWAIHIFNFIWADPIFSTFVWMKIVFFGVLTFATFGTLFVSEFLNVNYTRIDKVIKIVAWIWYPVLLILPAKPFVFVSQFVLMPYILLIGILTFYKFIFRTKTESVSAVRYIYLGVNTAIIITGINDVSLMMNIIDNSIIFYLNYGAAILILGVWFHMFFKYFGLLMVEKNFSTVLKTELDTQKENLEASLKREKAVIEQNAALNERDSMMRDLHDSFGARLMALIRVSDKEQKAHALAKDTLDELRFMTTPLRIEEQDIVTLLASFREQRLRQLEEAGYKVSWSVDEVLKQPTWNTQQAVEFLRILDELLGNALKHGSSDEISVELTNQPQLKLRFINPINPVEMNNSKGAGLDNIKIRSKKIGAEFKYSWSDSKFEAEIIW